MKKLYVLLVTLLFVGCNSEKRVLVDEVVHKDRCYYNSKPFSGIVFDVDENNGQLKWESVYKDGVRQGIYKQYYENGQIELEVTYYENHVKYVELFGKDGRIKSGQFTIQETGETSYFKYTRVQIGDNEEEGETTEKEGNVPVDDLQYIPQSHRKNYIPQSERGD